MIFSRKKIFNNITAFFLMLLLFNICIAINSLSLIGNAWIQYAELLTNGKLYAEHNLVVGPIFVVLYKLLTLFIINPNGIMILFSILYTFLAAFIYSQVKSLINIELPSLLITLLIYLLVIGFPGFRFDDYHFLSHLLIISSLLMFIKKENIKFIIIFGLIFSLNFYNRWHESLVVFIVVFLGISLTWKMERLSFLFINIVIFCFISLVLFHFFNIDLNLYIESTMIYGIKAKGDASNILVRPFVNYLNSLDIPSILIGITVLSFSYFFNEILDALKKISKINSDIVLFLMLFFFAVIFNTRVLKVICLLYPAIIMLLIIRYIFESDNNKINRKIFNTNIVKFILIDSSWLLILGVLWFYLQNMSAGGGVDSTYYGILPLIFYLLKMHAMIPERLVKALVILASVISVIIVLQKIIVPYSWHSSVNKASFISRTFVETSVGNVYMMKQDANLLHDICNDIDSKSNKVMLELPFSGISQYCGFKLYNTYVQSFYDFSSPDFLDKIILNLDINPPDFILIKYEPSNILSHQRIYGNVNPNIHPRYFDLYEKIINSKNFALSGFYISTDMKRFYMRFENSKNISYEFECKRALVMLNSVIQNANENIDAIDGLKYLLNKNCTSEEFMTTFNVFNELKKRR